MRKKNISIFILLSVYFSLFSQPGDILFSRLDINNGLSHNQVNTIIKDRQGFMWFGTMSGLNRYDGTSFKTFRHIQNDSSSLHDNFINKLIEDPEGSIWISTRNNFSIYNPINESFSRQLPEYLRDSPVPLNNITDCYQDNNNNWWILTNGTSTYCFNYKSKQFTTLKSTIIDPQHSSTTSINSIVQDSKGNFWIIRSDGVLEKFDSKTLKSIYYNDYFNKTKGIDNFYSMFIDSDNDIWIYTTNKADGVYWFQNNSKSFTHLSDNTGDIKLLTNIIRCIVQDNNHNVWIGTDHGGINILNKKTKKVSYILSNTDNENSLSQNTITSLYKDNTGIIWIGTFKKGINYYHENLIKFRLVKHQPSNPNSLGYDDVNCFADDASGNLWIGTNNGGLFYYDRKNEKFTNYKHNPSNPGSISNDIIVKLYIDKQQKLWIGTYFGGLDCYDGKTFTHYKQDPSNSLSISDNRIWEIFEDSKNNFWIGTLGGGLELFDRTKGFFYHYRLGDQNSVHSNYIIYIAEDKNRNLWIGTANGVDILDYQTGRFIHHEHENSNQKSLSNNNVICILADSRGLIWVGTREGLNLYNESEKNFNTYTTNNGLPDNTIQTILEDNMGKIWISTPNGIASITVINKDQKGNINIKCNSYDKSDGLQGKEFNEKASLKTKQGELIFGGSNGFNIFSPQAININNNAPKIVLTNLRIFNKNIDVNEKINGHLILKQSITQTQKLVLKYSENMFSIDFAALNYLHPEKNKYLYKLEGFNKDWISTSDILRRATYTNLDPGDYVFRVKASNDDGIWNETGTSIKIKVRPPFYRSIYAIILYILLLTGALILARKILLERARMRFRIEAERHEAQRLHDLDMVKIKFFTNVSHEFRTPLSLILAPIEKIIKNTHDVEQKKQFLLIQRNAKRLLNLVNQLLDFRRMEVQEFKLNPVSQDIVAFTKDITYSFSDISEKKNIQLLFHSNVESITIQFDTDKFEKIIFNLLSNAFKFTHEGGKIVVDIEYNHDENKQWLEIKVKDTGIGIAKDKHERIFEQFFQSEASGNMVSQGSGIGLSLAKEFVRLHNGSIWVESEPGKGSCFVVHLPIQEFAGNIGKQIIDEEIKSNESEQVIEEVIQKTNTPDHILLIEDNEDLRFYIKDNLKNKYNITEASDGNVGLKIAMSSIPDLIVSDIMMPGMDGIELCKTLKADRRTSHIPVILLTARGSDEQKMEGFKSGADDYITKPFSFEILESRVNNLISQRDKLRKAFQKQIEIIPNEISVTSLDEKLIQRALDLVEQHISDPNFSVEDLSKELGMSRVHLYKKLLSLTGKTPLEFIRVIRLKRAAQLLKKSQLTVAEIAFEVGFNNPKYFSKYFKDEFNELPSTYAQNENMKN